MTDIKIKRYADKENLKKLMKYSKDTFVNKNGDETIAGTKTFSSGVLSTTFNAFMAQAGGYTLVLRNDGRDTYLLMSDKDGAPGTFSSARPLRINNSTGVCDINGNAATATTAANGVDSYGSGWIRFINGIQICWGYATTGFAFPKPFTATPAVSLMHQTFTNRKIIINAGAMDSRNCYFNAYDVEGGIYVDAAVSYTAFGYWGR